MLKNKRLEIRINDETKAKLSVLAKSTTLTGTISELLDSLIETAIADVRLPINSDAREA
jgi:antitoxin component of RelBE/YafQ-DinJ toxin-antitoxin module